VCSFEEGFYRRARRSSGHGCEDVVVEEAAEPGEGGRRLWFYKSGSGWEISARASEENREAASEQSEDRSNRIRGKIWKT